MPLFITHRFKTIALIQVLTGKIKINETLRNMIERSVIYNIDDGEMTRSHGVRIA